MIRWLRHSAVRWDRALALACGIAAVFAALRTVPRERYFSRPAEKFDKAREHILRKAVQKQGLLGIWTFDPVPTDEGFLGTAEVRRSSDMLKELDPVGAGTVSTVGKFGGARKFDGEPDTGILVPPFVLPGADVTFSIWVKLDPVPRRQDIFCMTHRLTTAVMYGFRLEDGRIVFDVPEEPGEAVSVSAPFGRFGEFVHLAAAVRKAEKTAELYIDGELVASAPVRNVEKTYRWKGGFGWSSQETVRNPLHGVIDETLVWNRALSPGEIQRLAGRKTGFFTWAVSEKDRSRLRRRRLAARFLPFVGSFAYPDFLERGPDDRARMTELADIPELHLYLPQETRQDLGKAHRRSRLSRRRTDAGARPRSAFVGFDGSSEEITVCLHGTDRSYPDAERPSLVLAFPDGRRYLLLPPENPEWKAYRNSEDGGSGMDAEHSPSECRVRTFLPSLAMVRLRVNQSESGFRFLADASRMGARPGPGLRVGGKPIRTIGPDSAVGKALAEDSWIPFRKRERYARLEALNPPYTLPKNTAPEYDPALLGENLSPWRVTTDVVLPPGTWKSSNPEIVDPETGRVTRPENGPMIVELARVSDNRIPSDDSETLYLRVMPKDIAVASLFLDFGTDPEKLSRTDARVEVCLPGEDVPSRSSFGTQGADAGIRWRGNTSFYGPKRLLNIKTDEPLRLFPGSEDRGIVLVNGRQNPSFLGNTLATELFRSFPVGPGEPPRTVPRILFAEVFTNGVYAGLYEVSERINAKMTRSPDAIVYRHTVAMPRVPTMTPRHFSKASPDPFAPYLRFEKWVEEASAESDWEEILGHLDLGTFIDSRLLLNLLQNTNGHPFPYAASDALVYVPENDLYFCVPWDGDVCLKNRPWEPIDNRFDRVFDEFCPGYREKCMLRWRELRKSVIILPDLQERLLAIERRLAPYVPFDEWRFQVPHNFAEQCGYVRANLEKSIETMDSLYNQETP